MVAFHSYPLPAIGSTTPVSVKFFGKTIQQPKTCAKLTAKNGV
jgi:hypothetical protein